MAGDETRAERGVALVVALLITALFAALGAGLILVTSTEMRVAAAYHDATTTLQAADAALDLALTGLAGAGSLDDVLQGVEPSPFVDGAPGGLKFPGAGLTVDLDTLTHRLRCGRPRACVDAEIAETTDARPWGVNNPRWQPYVYGSLAALLPGIERGMALYVVAWVGDDALETDGDPTVDGALPGDPGHGLVRLHVEAHGTAGQRRAVEAVVGVDGPAIRVHSWKELR